MEGGWELGAIAPAKMLRVGQVLDPFGSRVGEGGGWAPTLHVGHIHVLAT